MTFEKLYLKLLVPQSPISKMIPTEIKTVRILAILYNDPNFENVIML